MRKILFITSLILFLLQALADQKYTITREIPNQYNARKIAFTDDQQIVILYSTAQPKIFFYRYFDFKLLHSTVPLQLVSLECFTGLDKQYTLLLGKMGGFVGLQKFNPQSSQQEIKLTVVQDCTLLKATASPNIQKYAVLCKNKNTVYVGDLSKPDGEADAIQIDFTVDAISWHPTQPKLAVAGTAQDNSFKIIVLNIQTKESKDYSTEIVKKTIDVQFSEDGLYLAYISEQSQFVTIIKLDDNTKSDLFASQTTQLLQIQRSASLLSAYDTQNTFIWVFNSDNYGKYTSTMKSTGLTKSGGVLITLDPAGNRLKVNQICLNGVFMNDKQTCAACQTPCKSCFFKQTQCSSCVDNYFLDEAKYLCKVCVQSCKVCTDAQTCKTCLDGFYLDNNLCNSCFAKYTGCAVCDAKNCSKCAQADNWQFYNGSCVCKAKYVQDQEKCVSCPQHCLSCNDTKTCVYCDIFQFRKLTPVNGKCICDTKYYETLDGNCAACLTGCLTCEYKNTCQVCDGANHWALDLKDNSCVCAAGYFLSKDVCTSCSNGCVTCSSQKNCSVCDNSKHWMLDQKTHACTCQSGYILSLTQCASCSSLIEGCSSCSDKNTCLSCIDGYNYNGDSKKCEKVSSGGVNVVVIIVVGIAVLIGLAVGSFFIVRFIRKRKGKRVETLLETEGGEQIEQMG